MSRRLTLHLTARHNAALDRILGSDDRDDNDQRRRAVEQLILDGAREPGDRAAALNTAVVESTGATDGSAARNDTESTVRLIDRLRASRDRYRDLAVRAEAALLGVPVRDLYYSIERRLERALHDKGFRMPAASDPRRRGIDEAEGTAAGGADSRCSSAASSSPWSPAPSCWAWTPASVSRISCSSTGAPAPSSSRAGRSSPNTR